jgi:hypothetical protein
VATLFNKGNKAFTKRFNCKVFATSTIAPLCILAINAFERAMREEECAASSGASKGWFFTKVWPPTEHARFDGTSTIASLTILTVSATLAWAKGTSFKMEHRKINLR